MALVAPEKKILSHGMPGLVASSEYRVLGVEPPERATVNLPLARTAAEA